MRTFTLLLAGAAIAASTAAYGAVRVVGTTDARACYEAARDERATEGTVQLCTTALKNEELSKRDTAATMINRGILRMYQRNYDLAFADYEAAIALKPDMGEAHVNKAIAMLRMDQRQAEAATASLTRGIELGTSEPEVAHYMRAVAYEILGDAKKAYLDYKRASELSPAWQDPQVALRRFTVTKSSG